MKCSGYAFLLVLVSGCQSMSQSQKRVATTFTTSIIAGIAGRQLAVQQGGDADEEKSMYMSMTLGALGGNLAGEYFFHSQTESENRNLRHIKEQQEAYMIEEGLKKTTPQHSYFPDSGNSLDYNQMTASLATLINPNCKTIEYSLGFDNSTKEERFIAVSDQVVIEAFRYYLVIPRDGQKSPCVKAHSSFGYLQREFHNLPDILIEKALKSKKK